MRDKEWRKLIYTLRQGNSILVLGPEIPCSEIEDVPAVGPDGEPLPLVPPIDTLPAALARHLFDEGKLTLSLNPNDLAQVAELYHKERGRSDLEEEVVRFYRDAPFTDVYTDLANIPFNVIISLTHDTSLVTALRDAGKFPVVELYDFQGEQREAVGLGRDPVGVGTAQKPLVFYLYGHPDVPRSMVVSETDSLKFLTAVMGKSPGLPSDLRSHLSHPDKSFLLLGFGITRWYLRILLHLLSANLKDSKSFAFESIDEPDQTFTKQTILFLRKGWRFESKSVKVAPFVRELRERVEAGGIGSGDSKDERNRRTLSPEGPSIFISYAREDESLARMLHDALKDGGYDPWYDKEGLSGGDRWEDVIPATIKETDYVVVVQSRALSKKNFSYVNREIGLACERQQFARGGIRFIIPVRVDDSPLIGELEGLQAIDVRCRDDVRQIEAAIVRDQQRRRRSA